MKKQKINENYFLIGKEVKNETTVDVEQDVNHIIIIDVSGSMSYDLPEIRKNLKNKISNITKKNSDTISIIWFSGRNEAGILKESVKVNSLKQLSDLNDAIDKFLKPIGMTAFAKPLELANEIIDRSTALNPNLLTSLVFMSDGGNNDVSWTLVNSALDKLVSKLSSATIVEYGNWADSKKLTDIAATLGGSKINCDGFEEYDIVIKNSLNKSIKGGKKISVDIDNYLYDFAFSISGDDILLYTIIDNKILVNENINNIYYFTSDSIDKSDIPFNESELQTALYAATYVLSDKLLNDDAEKIFYLLGDNYYYRMLLNAYGKQKLNAFKSAIKECVSDVSKRFPDGKSTIKAINDDAFCLMNLIDDLGKLDNCLLFTNHKDFNYNRIGAKRVAIGSKLTESEKNKLAEAKNVKELVELSKELEENKLDLKFVTTNPESGSPIKNLVWNESRANLSILVRYEGSVELPSNNYGLDSISSFRYKTYNIVKDGIINIKYLPVSYSDELKNLLERNNVLFDIDHNEDTSSPEFIVIDLSSLPIINRRMVKSLSAKSLAELEYELLKLQCDAKVYGDYRKILFPKKSKEFTELVGFECSEWLKTIGITDYNGFAPKTSAELNGDVYISINLDVKLKGYSSLPKVSDVVAKLALPNPVLKPAELIMSKAIKEILPRLSDEDLEDFIINKTNEIVSRKRELLQQKAEIVFSIILSKKWFTEFKSFDDNSISLTIDGNTLNFTFLLEEKQVKL